MNFFELNGSKFPKLDSPFLRAGELLKKKYTCIDEIVPGFEWCFDIDQCFVSEKLDGTNVKIEVRGNELLIFGRNVNIPEGYQQCELNDRQYKYIVQSVINYVGDKEKKMQDGIFYGESIGPRIQKNPYRLEKHKWFNFDPMAGDIMQYTDYPQTSNFPEWREWMLNIKSLLNPEVPAEGVIFLNKHTGQMAKLRRDMFK